MSRLRVGIDIGTRAVKAAWRDPSTPAEPGSWRMVSQARQPDDPPERLAAIVHELLAPLRRHQQRVEVVLGAAQGHIRRLRLEADASRDVALSIRERLPKLFPLNPERCAVRHRVLDAGGDSDAGCEVQAAACDVLELYAHLRMVWSGGWLVRHAWPSAYAVAALAVAQGFGQDEPVVLLELGARRLVVALLSRGEIVLAREVALGSDVLTEALMGQVTVGEQRVQLSWEEAEGLKCRIGILPGQHSAQSSVEGRMPVATYLAMLQPILEQWAGEIKRTIAYSAQSHPEVAPKRLLVCGGASKLAGLEWWLAQQLQLAVQRLSLAPLIGEDRPEFAVACGLVVARPEACVDLLPSRAERARRVVQAASAVSYGLLGLAVALWMGVAIFGWQRQAVERQAAAATARQRELAPVRDLSQTLEAHERLVREVTGAQAAPGEWLRRLADGFPSALRLTSLADDAAGQVQLTGQAQGREQAPEASVSEFAMWLERSGLCGEVRLGSSQRSPSLTDIVEFGLVCRRR